MITITHEREREFMNVMQQKKEQKKNRNRCLVGEESVEVGLLCSTLDAVSIYHLATPSE